MTMPTPDKIGAYADRLLGRARDMVAAPESMEARKAYMRATFNLDWTAAAIVALAERGSETLGKLARVREFIEHELEQRESGDLAGYAGDAEEALADLDSALEALCSLTNAVGDRPTHAAPVPQPFREELND